MLRKNFVLITMAAGLVAGRRITARAQDAGALLDLLVKKRIITDQEAEEVRGELVKEVATTSRRETGNSPRRSPRSSSTATCASVTKRARAKPARRARSIGPTTPCDGAGSVIGSASACAARWRTTGSLACGSKPAPTPDPPTSLLATTPDRSAKPATPSESARLISATAVFGTSDSPSARCRTPS